MLALMKRESDCEDFRNYGDFPEDSYPLIMMAGVLGSSEWMVLGYALMNVAGQTMMAKF